MPWKKMHSTATSPLYGSIIHQLNNPPIRGEPSQGIHEDSDWPDWLHKQKHKWALQPSRLLPGALHICSSAISTDSGKCK